MNIEDKLIEPYFIKSDGESFDLYEKKVIQSGKNEGQVTETVRGYYISLEGVLKRIVQLKVANSNDVLTLKDYLTQYNQLSGEIAEVIKSVTK